MTHQVVPVKVFAAVFGALLVLTVTTVVVSKFDFGEFNLIAAMAIAVTKAALVAMFFMDVRRAASLTKLVVGAGIFWLGLLLSFLLIDYLMRGSPPRPHWF